MKNMILILTISMFSLLPTVLSAATAVIEFEENVQPGTTILVDTFNGKVEISSWEESFVKITATKKARKESYLENAIIEINNSEKLEIKAVPLKKNSKVGVSLEIKVPKDVVIELVDTSNGAIIINEVKGDGRFDTSNGRIEIHNCQGEFLLDTSNGAIKCENVAGRVSADTSNGSIKLYNVSEIQYADTSNGSITAEIERIYNDMDLSTSNGSITVYLSNELDATIKAGTSNSSLKLEDVAIQVESQSRTKLRGTMGSGQHNINISTSNGGIKIMGMAD